MRMTQIVALHGFTGSGADFDATRCLLQKNTEWHAPDLPGHGKNADLRDCNLAKTLDLLTVYLEERKLHRPALLGYSMGGRIALHWALRKPELFSKLILVSASPGLASEKDRHHRRIADACWIQKLREEPRDAWIRSWTSQNVLKTQQHAPTEVLAPIRQRQIQADAEGWIAAMEGLGNGVLPSLWDVLAQMPLHVDLVAGASDEKFKSINTEMAKLLPSYSQTVIPDCGHSPHIENPERFATTLRECIERSA